MYLDMPPQRESLEYLKNLPETAPTPLDPYSISRSGISYLRLMQISYEDRIREFQERNGLDDIYADLALRELDDSLMVRTERNHQSYTRLREALKEDSSKDLDADVLDAIRIGAACPTDLLRLIQSYPEMISVEFFKRTTPFSLTDAESAERQLQQQLSELVSNARNDSISLYEKEKIRYSSRPFTTENGALIWKQKIGLVEFDGGAIEIILKRSAIALPPDVHIANSGAQTYIQKNGEKLFMLCPLGMSAYFRTSDYSDRGGYEPPTEEKRDPVDQTLYEKLGSLAHQHTEILSQIPEEMHDVYLSHITPTTGRDTES